MTFHADKADNTIIYALQRLKLRPDLCLTLVGASSEAVRTSFSFFWFYPEQLFSTDCKVWWWLTAPGYPSIKTLLRSFSGDSWVCRCCSLISSLPYCDMGFGSGACRLLICSGEKGYQCLCPLSKVWQTGCVHC